MRNSLIAKALFRIREHNIKLPFTLKPEKTISSLWNDIKDTRGIFIVSELMEGIPVVYMLDRRKKLHVYLDGYEETIEGAWTDIAEKCHIRKGLREARKTMGINVAIEGTITGSFIPGNPYGFDRTRFFVSSVYNAETGKHLPYKDLMSVVAITHLDRLPLVKRSPLLGSLDEMIADADGLSVFGNAPRKGLVWENDEAGVRFVTYSKTFAEKEKEGDLHGRNN